jgi:hypothetical protein
VVLLKVYPVSVAVFPFKGDPPWSVDGYREALGLALERVQSQPWHRELPEVLCRVECRQSQSHAVEQVGPDASRQVLKLLPRLDEVSG